jgi:hypothetical protein
MRCSFVQLHLELGEGRAKRDVPKGQRTKRSRCTTCGNSLSSLCKLRPFKCYTARHRYTRRDRRQYVEMMSRLMDPTYAPALARKLRGSESLSRAINWTAIFSLTQSSEF